MQKGLYGYFTGQLRADDINDGKDEPAVPLKPSVVISAATLKAHRAIWTDLTLENVRDGEVSHVWISIFDKDTIEKMRQKLRMYEERGTQDILNRYGNLSLLFRCLQ